MTYCWGVFYFSFLHTLTVSAFFFFLTVKTEPGALFMLKFKIYHFLLTHIKEIIDSVILICHVIFFFSFFFLVFLSSLVLSDQFYDSIFLLIHINYNSYFTHFFRGCPVLKTFINSQNAPLNTTMPLLR